MVSGNGGRLSGVHRFARWVAGSGFIGLCPFGACSFFSAAGAAQGAVALETRSGTKKPRRAWIEADHGERPGLSPAFGD